MRQSASEVLSRIGPGDREETHFATFINAAQHRKKTAVSVIAELLRDLDRDVRQAAAESLGRIGDPGAVEVLSLAKDDLDGTVRLAVRQALTVLQS